MFWLGVVFMGGYGVIVCCNVYESMSNGYADYFGGYTMYDLCRYHSMATVYLPPVFCALFLGTEYEHGTIRNKLIAGKSRGAVYLSSLILSLAACLLMIAAYFLPVVCVGPFITEGLGVSPGMLALIVGGELLMTAALCGLCTVGSMLISRKAILAVVLLLAVLVLLGVATTIESRLEEQEFYQGLMMNDDGEIVDMSDIPNSGYLTGMKREVYQFIVDFLPTGQALLYNFDMAVHPWQMCLYSLLILCASTAGGIAAFRRKDIK